MEQNETKATLEAGTLYDMNKQLVDQEKEMSKSKIRELTDKLFLWFVNQMDKRRYYMLLNNDKHDYTVFVLTEQALAHSAAKECIGCLTDRGGLVSGDKLQDGNWEFWIHTPEGESIVYYLFDYTQAVIEC